MTLEDIMNEWEKDSRIDSMELGDEAIKTGSLHSKYMRYLSTHRLLSKSKWIEYKERKEWKRLYYRGDFNNPEDLKKYGVEPWRGRSVVAEIDKMIDGDEELNKMLLKKEYHDEIVSFCEAIVKELNNRTFAIGTAVKYHVFMGGG